MKRIALLMILVLGFSEPTLALQQPSPGQHDARVRTVTYDPANVVKVNGVIRALTQVVFADDEEVATAALGDVTVREAVQPWGDDSRMTSIRLIMRRSDNFHKLDKIDKKETCLCRG